MFIWLSCPPTLGFRGPFSHPPSAYQPPIQWSQWPIWAHSIMVPWTCICICPLTNCYIHIFTLYRPIITIHVQLSSVDPWSTLTTPALSNIHPYRTGPLQQCGPIILPLPYQPFQTQLTKVENARKALASHLCPILSLCFNNAFSHKSGDANCT